MTFMQLKQVSQSTWAIVDGSTYGSVGVIRLPAYIIIIDTGMTPALAKEFRNKVLKEIGSPITHVLLTHYHSDHVFGSQEFNEALLIASSKMVSLYPELLESHWSPQGLEEMRKFYAENEPKFSRQLENIKIITPPQTFKKSLFIGENQEVEMKHTGGHTVGHSTVYFVPEKVLFAGDLVFCQEYPYAGDQTNNPPDWMKAFEVILKMPIEAIVPGHGPLCDKEEIRTQLAYFAKLESWIQMKISQDVSLETIQEQQETGPTPPYNLKADRRLPLTIERWYNFYSTQKNG